jgi:ABC-2 type transport system ATP-binding protein
MKRRLGLAAALMPDVQLIILDEPQEGLDPAGIAELRTLLVHEAEGSGKTIFISSHRLSEVERICDRVIIIDQGALLIQGQLADLLGPGPELIRIETRHVDQAREMLTRQGCWIAPWGTGETNLWFSRPACTASQALLAAPGVGEQVHPRSLETLFLALTGSSISL